MEESNLKHGLVSARSILTKQSLFLYTSSKTLIRYYRSDAAKALHDQVYKQTSDALDLINSIYSNKIKPNDFEIDNGKSAEFLDSLKYLDVKKI